MRVTRSIVAGAAVFLAAIAPTIAVANVPIRLEWVAPARCPSRADVLADIERTLGNLESSSFAVARIVVSQKGSAFRAEIQLTASGSTTIRTLEADTCRAVATAAALIVALAVNADAAPAASPSSPPGTPTPTPEAPAPPSPAATPENEAPPVLSRVPEANRAAPGPGEPAPMPLDEPPFPPPASRTRGALGRSPSSTTPVGAPLFRGALSLAASMVLDTSLLPSAAYGADVSVGWSPGQFDLELIGLFLGSRRATLLSNPSQGADLSLAQLGARACYGAGGALLRVGPCAGIGFAWTVARGFGPANDHPSDATGQTLVAELGGYGALRLSPHFSIRIHAAAVLPVAHPVFTIDGGGDVFHTPNASFRTTVGIGAHF